MTERGRRRLGGPSSRVAILAVVAGALLSPPSARAATFDVTAASADAVDVNPGDGLCDDGAGNCTMRAAIQESNASAAVDDVIEVPSGTYELTIAGAGEDLGTTGDLDLSDGVTIAGAGAGQTIIDQGGDQDRVLDVGPPGAETVAIEDLTVTGGQAAESGAGMLIRGGTVALQRLAVTQNTATAFATDLEGGGIAIFGIGNPIVTIEDSAISQNTVERTDSDPGASPDGGGVSAGGGAASSLTIAGSTISGTQAIAPNSLSHNLFGGGVRATVSALSIVNTTISGNVAGRAGGVASSSPGAVIEGSTSCWRERGSGWSDRRPVRSAASATSSCANGTRA